jgi:hypothetical protein
LLRDIELQLPSYETGTLETGTLDAQRISLLYEGEFGLTMLVHLAAFEQFSVTRQDSEPSIPYRSARLIQNYNPDRPGL